MIDNLKICVFDCETTGINRKHNDLPKQPHIIQYAHAIIHTNNGNYDVEEVLNKYYKPPVAIPERSTAVHGITDDRVEKKGSIVDDILYIRNKLKEVDVLVAHNGKFDLNQLWIELARIGQHKGFYDETAHKLVDTMKQSKKYVQAKDKRGRLKYPRLEELYGFLFDEELENSHCALVDVEATLSCFQELISRKVITL